MADNTNKINKIKEYYATIPNNTSFMVVVSGGSVIHAIGYKADDNYGQFTAFYYDDNLNQSYKGVCYHCYGGAWVNDGAHVLTTDLIGTANVMLITSSVQAGSNFFTNSFYVPTNLQVKINIVNVFGADGNFKDNFAVNRSGSYVSFYTTNSNLAGKMCTFNITLS